MEMKPALLAAALAVAFTVASASATERYFTYTYEPETMPKGLFEYEQWITLRAGRNSAVGQEQYRQWQFRHEFEYGLTDNYTVSLYINESLTNFREPGSGRHISHFQFDSVSLENRYLLLNPVDHPVGLALYLEPTIGEKEAELEQKLILGQRHGDWKWAFNLTHATEWGNDFHSYEGELEASFGITREINPHWSIGFEFRDHNELPEYRIWENTAFYAGPVISCHTEKWWATLSVMPQIFGVNFAENADNDHNFELEGHERMNVRLIVGISF